MLVQYNGKNEQGFSKVNSYSFSQVLSKFSRKTHPPHHLPPGKGELNSAIFRGLRPEKPRPAFALCILATGIILCFFALSPPRFVAASGITPMSCRKGGLTNSHREIRG